MLTAGWMQVPGDGRELVVCDVTAVAIRSGAFFYPRTRLQQAKETSSLCRVWLKKAPHSRYSRYDVAHRTPVGGCGHTIQAPSSCYIDRLILFFQPIDGSY